MPVTTTTLFAAGVFGSIGMLAWGAAAVVPLVLHLWNRHKHKEAPWAAMEFLLAAVQEQARRMRLEQLLLLLLRMAIPIVLALALADPLWQMLPSIGSSLGSRVPHHHLFVFDVSYSMGYQVDGKSRFEQAKQIAREIVEKSPQGDGFTIVTLASPSQIVVSSPAFSPDDIRAEIAGLELHDNIAELGTALELTKQTLNRVKSEYPRLAKHRVYFLTDLGETTWHAATQSKAKAQIGEIESDADIVMIDVGQSTVTNSGISSVRRTPPVITPTTNVNWQVTVNNFAGSADGNREVELIVDGKLAAKESLTLSSGTPASVAFQYRFDTGGSHTVDFHLSDDALAVDNHYYESIVVRDELQILCVEGKTGSARNVALALAPNTSSNVLVRTLPDHRLGETLLQDFDAVFLCNVGRFTAQSSTQLKEYLALGRGVVMFLGDLAATENYNELLFDEAPQQSTLPARLLGTSPDGNYQLAPRDYRHPIVQPFRGQERAGLLTTPVFRYTRLAVPEQSRSNVALEFSNGDPAIVEHTPFLKNSGGRFTLVAIAPSEQSVSRDAGSLKPWTAWSAWPSFPPLVQEMLSFSIAGQDTERNRMVGDPISGILPAASGSQFVLLTQPNGTNRRISVQEGRGGSPVWQHSETPTSGIYTVKVPDNSTTENFAVNLSDTQESELTRVPLNELPSQFQQNSIATGGGTGDTDIQIASTPLFRLVLGLLLLLMLTESFVAWYLGNARS